MPPASRRSSARACECCCDEGRFAFCVGLTVEWMLGRERTLQSGVAFTQSRVCAQCIPEGHMGSQFIRCLRHHIEVMSRLARRTAKRLAPCHPQITLVDIPQTGEASDYPRRVRSRDDNVEVDDWLCGETRNCGAPDVLDPQHKVAQRRLHSRSEHREAIWPRRVILADQ